MARVTNFSTQPANIMPGLQAFTGAVESYGKFQREKTENAKIEKLKQKASMLLGQDPDVIAKEVAANPELRPLLQQAMGAESDAMVNMSKQYLINQQDPFELHAAEAEKDILEGRDPSGNIEMARAMLSDKTRVEATKQHEAVLAMFDQKAYENYKKSQGGATTDTKDTRTAEIKNYEYGLENPKFAALKIKADQNKLTTHELRLATMLANGEIDASQLPKRGNTYNKIVAGAKELNPELDIRTATADYALSKNPTFRQKAMTAEVLPDIMKHVVDAGKKVNFSNVRKFGTLQRFYKENMNDPDLVEYLALRNDALMEIASVMRGAGMSDKAHEAEVEAMDPRMSPRALDAWIKAQTTALKPRLALIRKIITGKGKPTPDGEMTKEEYNKLPSGATYTLGGKTYRKK